MASKALAAIAIILLVVVVLFFIDTRAFLEPILDRLSPNKSAVTTKAVLWVDGYVDEANSPEGSYALEYSVSNLGDAMAENVTLVAVVDGEQQANQLIPSLEVSDNANYSLAVSASSGELHIVSLQASCEDSVDGYSFSFGTDVPRAFGDYAGIARLFVTPREPSLVALKDMVLKDAPLKVKDWIALRNWVGDNIRYVSDLEVHGVREYWQFGKETVALGTGDCEDFAVLLCSLLRAAGYSSDDVYVVVGKSGNDYHAWVKINLGTLGWYNLEPQENGLATVVGDFVMLSDFQALCQFNDQQFREIE
jgi:predicted transglutaminase-like cysteine proteinase